MIKVYDQADFPANMSENLQPLLDNNLIVATQNFENGTPNKYEITENGKTYLDKNFDDEEVISYIRTMHNFEQLLFLTQTYINRKKGL